MVTTINWSSNFWSPTQQCFDWCKEQHFANMSKLTFDGLMLPIICIALLLIYTQSEKLLNILNITMHERDRLERMICRIPELCLYLLIGFLTWVVWFMPR